MNYFLVPFLVLNKQDHNLFTIFKKFFLVFHLKSTRYGLEMTWEWINHDGIFLCKLLYVNYSFKNNQQIPKILEPALINN